jgi:hypothetical protein
MMRSFPANAACYFMFERTVDSLQRMQRGGRHTPDSGTSPYGDS